MIPFCPVRPTVYLLLLFALVLLSSARAAQPAEDHSVADTTRIVQPGAPGAPSRVITGDAEAVLPAHAEADVRFMHGMILHHAQALEMTALVPEQTENETIRRLALRIETSQHDEIRQMLRWLERRGESFPSLPEVVADLEEEFEEGNAATDRMHGDHGEHDHTAMYGMLSEEQIGRLAEAAGEEFDRLFLKYMIQHHEGALVMVDELFAAEGAGQEGEIYTFASHVESDQIIEIRRMQRMLEAD